jgi:aspartate-semialdehyde dehydrogenase
MRIAVLGATGLVGRTMLRLLEDCAWVTDLPVALASSRSAGAPLPFRGGTLTCREVTAEALAGLDVVLMSAGGAASRQWAPVAAAAGARVIDNSSAWRLDPDVPLVVPEINGRLVSAVAGGGIIANPNCSTIQVAMAVAPLAHPFGLAEVHVTTLQAVSGAGQRGIEALGDGPGTGEVFPRPIRANVIPAIGAPLDDGSFEEEAKVERELRRILDRSRLAVTCTATRVPVVTGHSAAVRVVCQRPVDIADAADALAAWPGLEVVRDPHNYATPLEIAGRTVCHVGRLRSDPGDDRALLMWVVADNLLKGAAWNAVQIAGLLAGSGGA